MPAMLHVMAVQEVQNHAAVHDMSCADAVESLGSYEGLLPKICLCRECKVQQSSCCAARRVVESAAGVCCHQSVKEYVNYRLTTIAVKASSKWPCPYMQRGILRGFSPNVFCAGHSLECVGSKVHPMTRCNSAHKNSICLTALAY